MKTLATQRRLAAEILGIGKGRVWFDPERLVDIGEALTKADIEELIKDKAIKAKPIAKRIKRKERRKTKKRRGPGRIKMKVKKRKQRYVKRIRKLRNYLKMLKSKAAITVQESHHLRKLVKAGQFKSKREMQNYVQNILKKIAKKTEIEEKKPKLKKPQKKKEERRKKPEEESTKNKKIKAAKEQRKK